MRTSLYVNVLTDEEVRLDYPPAGSAWVPPRTPASTRDRIRRRLLAEERAEPTTQQRDQTVARLAASGWTADEIADCVGLAVQTVKNKLVKIRQADSDDVARRTATADTTTLHPYRGTSA